MLESSDDVCILRKMYKRYSINILHTSFPRMQAAHSINFSFILQHFSRQDAGVSMRTFLIKIIPPFFCKSSSHPCSKKFKTSWPKWTSLQSKSLPEHFQPRNHKISPPGSILGAEEIYFDLIYLGETAIKDYSCPFTLVRTRGRASKVSF